MKYRIVHLHGMPGVHKALIEARWVKSGKQALAALRAGYAATDAREDGAMNAWRDDEGKYRVHSLRYLKTLEEKTFDTAKEAAAWVDRWMARKRPEKAE